jgi:hypothetical protein
MSRSIVEVPDVDAIIDTLQPHPVVTSVESRQWFSLPHTTIHVQGTAGVHISPRGCYRTAEFPDQVASTIGVHHCRPNRLKYLIFSLW